MRYHSWTHSGTDIARALLLKSACLNAQLLVWFAVPPHLRNGKRAYRLGKQLTKGMAPGHCWAMFGGFAGGGGGGIGVGNKLGPSQ